METGNILQDLTVKTWFVKWRIILGTPEEEIELIDKIFTMLFVNKSIQPLRKDNSPEISQRLQMPGKHL
jgi:hypothetical protein